MPVRVTDVREITRLVSLGLGGNESDQDIIPPHGGVADGTRVERASSPYSIHRASASRGKRDLHRVIRGLAA